MKTLHKFLFGVGLLLAMVSCSSTSRQIQANPSGFPLQRSKVIPVDHSIEKIAISDTWLATSSPGSITAVDLMTNKTSWTIGNLLLDKDSDLQIVNGSLIAATYQSIMIVNSTGQSRTLNLKSNNQDVVQLLAAYENYVYIIRGSDWTMEAYDYVENRFLWETRIGRGQSDAYLDSKTGIAYIVTPQSVYAFQNSDGELLWKQPTATMRSAFENSIIYLCQSGFRTNAIRLVAINSKDQTKIWETNLNLEVGSEIHELAIVQDLLIVTTRFYHFAVDKNDGSLLWKDTIEDDVFYNDPVELNGILYAKGAGGKIYAISPKDGSLLGYETLVDAPTYQSRYDASQKIFRLNNGIVVNTDREIIVFEPK